VPDQKLRLPFLNIEFKSQAKNGTHYVATSQVAGAGAIALNGNLELIQRSFGVESLDYDEPQFFSVTMDHQLACVNVHWLKAPAEGEQHSFHVEGLSQHLLRDANGIRAVSRAIKNILDYGADARLRTLCSALDAYRETVIRNRNVANVQRERQHDYRPESHIEQRSKRTIPAPEAQVKGVSYTEEIQSSRPLLEPVQPVHSGQQGRRGVPAPEVQVGDAASYEQVRTSRPPIEPVRPVHNEQRSRRGVPAPGEVSISRTPPEPLQPFHTEQRPQHVPTTTRRQVQTPVAISARVTRLSSKRSSRVMEYD
jgi:hypothetical protein